MRFVAPACGALHRGHERSGGHGIEGKTTSNPAISNQDFAAQRLNAPRPAHLSEPVDAALYESAARLSMPQAISGLAFVVTGPSGHTIRLDTNIESGGANSGPEPLELILLALGSCTGMDVISILRKKRQMITGYSINVYANLAKEHPKTYTKIMVEHIIQGQGVNPQAVARSIELSVNKYCPVNALLSRATQVEHVFRILDSMPGPQEPGVVGG